MPENHRPCSAPSQATLSKLPSRNPCDLCYRLAPSPQRQPETIRRKCPCAEPSNIPQGLVHAALQYGPTNLESGRPPIGRQTPTEATAASSREADHPRNPASFSVDASAIDPQRTSPTAPISLRRSGCIEPEWAYLSGLEQTQQPQLRLRTRA